MERGKCCRVRPFPSIPWFALFKAAVFILCSVLLSASALAQPKAEIRKSAPLDRAKAEQRGKALVTELLQQKPEEKSTTLGTLQIRGSDRKTRYVPIRFQIEPTPTNTISTYEAGATNGQPGVKLTVFQSGTQPNEYLLSEGTAGSAPKRLTGNQTMVPFAGSDFWVADLGLEFLHWPSQLVLRNEMSRGQSCEVLESDNPQSTGGAYGKVLSWIAADRPGIVIVHAEAYDGRGQLLKEFDPKKLEKIAGQWQLQQMEIRNVQANSRTRIVFNLDEPK